MRNRKNTGKKYDVGEQVIAQIRELAGGDIIVEMIRERPWASITFTGTRHKIGIRCESANSHLILSRLRKKLPTHEFVLHANFVADCAVLSETPAHNVSQRLLTEILTISDPVH